MRLRLTKIYAITKKTTDYSGCYYEGDNPSVSIEIVDFAITWDEALDKMKKHTEKTNKAHADIWIDISDNIEIPRSVLKHLWDHRDDN